MPSSRHRRDPSRPRRGRHLRVSHKPIDFRGDGGYIVIPPSVVTGDRGSAFYRVRQISTGHMSTLDSDRLRDFLDPRPAPAPRAADQVREVSVERLAAWVAGRAEGERNRGLFWAACRLAEKGNPPADAYAALAPAAEHAGLTMREVSATIRSAYRTTHPEPRPTRDRPAPEPRRVPQHAAGRVLS